MHLEAGAAVLLYAGAWRRVATASSHAVVASALWVAEGAGAATFILATAKLASQALGGHKLDGLQAQD